MKREQRKTNYHHQKFIEYVKNNSTRHDAAIRNVIRVLGYDTSGGKKNLKNLSGRLADCARYGAANGFIAFRS
jgi:hypothetical protein